MVGAVLFMCAVIPAYADEGSQPVNSDESVGQSIVTPAENMRLSVDYYEDQELVSDVYLYPDDDFSSFKYKAGNFKVLYSAQNGDALEFVYSWDQADFDNAMDRGETLFTVQGEILPLDPQYEGWSQAQYDRWDRGEIQVASGRELSVTVHIRPEALVTVYRPSVDAEVQTLWIDRDSPTPFSQLYLIDSDYLWQEDSPYDWEYLEFEITWDESSYIEGLASGADTFEITGSYGEAYDTNDQRAEALYKKGLIRSEGCPRTVIRVRNTENQIFENPYISRFDRYVYPYELSIYVRPNTSYADISLPQIGDLDSVDGDWEASRTFGYEWDQSDYEAGIASGADCFTVRGAYGPGADWPAKDRERWDAGKISITEATPSPCLKVHILRDDLPFTVQMQGPEDELLPVFTFPWPNGADQVTLCFSTDKQTWYAYDMAWCEECQWGEVSVTAIVYDDDDQLMVLPGDAPFYCRITVDSGGFSGDTKVMIVSPRADGSWDMAEDQGGDHGGGGQGEHQRPGKDETQAPPDTGDDASGGETSGGSSGGSTPGVDTSGGGEPGSPADPPSNVDDQSDHTTVDKSTRPFDKNTSKPNSNGQGSSNIPRYSGDSNTKEASRVNSAGEAADPSANTSDPSAAKYGAAGSGIYVSEVFESGTVESGVIDSNAVDSNAVDSGAADSNAVDSGAADSNTAKSDAATKSSPTMSFIKQFIKYMTAAAATAALILLGVGLAKFKRNKK